MLHLFIYKERRKEKQESVQEIKTRLGTHGGDNYDTKPNANGQEKRNSTTYSWFCDLNTHDQEVDSLLPRHPL